MRGCCACPGTRPSSPSRSACGNRHLRRNHAPPCARVPALRGAGAACDFWNPALTEVRVHVEVPQEQIEAFCRKWKIREFALFGSVLRDDFRPDSDVDVLVEFEPDTRFSLFDFVHMQDELGQIDRKSTRLNSSH